MGIDWAMVDYKTMLRVVFYGRVSTEHESQLSALKNQIQWYQDQADMHPEWTVVAPVETYLDRGITGTQAKKRPGFLKLIKDAEAGKFDLIVTREVCRFARNTVETLEYVRKLQDIDIEVYFVNDSIKTIRDRDGEFKLTIMAMSAQEESRKVSERAKAGQYISRQNGVLYGTSNIMGYERIRKKSDDDKRNAVGDKSVPTFKIVPEQAETVSMIYQWYLEGYGLKRIKTMLIQNDRKNSVGTLNWFESTISRILENPMYIGKQYQCKTTVVNFLNGKVKKNSKEDYVLIDGDFEPILAEETFYAVQRIKQKKQETNPFQSKGEGGKTTSDKWLPKLECGCGSKMRFYHWRTNKTTGEEVIGYTCKHRILDGSKEYREKRGMDTTGACSIKSIPDWHLEMMALKVFSNAWGDKKEGLIENYRLVEEFYSSKKNVNDTIREYERQRDSYNKKIAKLLELFTDDIISKEEYQRTRKEYMDNINWFNEAIEREKDGTEEESQKIKLQQVKEALEQYVDFTGEKIDDVFMESFVDKIVMRDNHSFEWLINLSGDALDFKSEKYSIAHNAPIEDKSQNTLNMIEGLYKFRFEVTINFDEARAFRKRFGKYLRTNQWEDIKVSVYSR